MLGERLLGLAGKKTRMGCLSKGFHFCGVQYHGTRIPEDVERALMDGDVGGAVMMPLRKGSRGWCLHGRTVRRARERIKLMVVDGFMPEEIVGYLVRWARWWGFLDGEKVEQHSPYGLAGLFLHTDTVCATHILLSFVFFCSPR